MSTYALPHLHVSDRVPRPCTTCSNEQPAKPLRALQMMMNELMNITNAVGAVEAGAAHHHLFGGADARQRGLDLRQRVRRMAGAGGGRGIGPLSVGPPFVLASAGGVPQHRCA